MKIIYLSIAFLILCLNTPLWGQDTVTDYDGNAYHTVIIGSQVWLKENITSLHYDDGTDIPDVVAYNNSDSLAQIFGRLYTWNAAMKNVTTSGAQGVCPNGWHVPSSAQFTQLEIFLGGSQVAGGKMKDTTAGMWTYSATAGATNSSGFSALPAGEYDAHEFMMYQLLHDYAVFWTSTQTGSLLATERYLEYNSAKCQPYNWYKVMKYSVRCVRDQGVGTTEPPNDESIRIINPVKDYLRIVTDRPQDLRLLEIYDLHGNKLMVIDLSGSNQDVNLDMLSPGLYLAKVYYKNSYLVKRFMKL